MFLLRRANLAPISLLHYNNFFYLVFLSFIPSISPFIVFFFYIANYFFSLSASLANRLLLCLILPRYSSGLLRS